MRPKTFMLSMVYLVIFAFTVVVLFFCCIHIVRRCFKRKGFVFSITKECEHCRRRFEIPEEPPAEHEDANRLYQQHVEDCLQGQRRDAEANRTDAAISDVVIRPSAPVPPSPPPPPPSAPSAPPPKIHALTESRASTPPPSYDEAVFGIAEAE